MPSVSGNVGAVFNGGTITTPLVVRVAQGGSNLLTVEDNTGSVALTVQNDLTVGIGQAHSGLSQGLTVNPDSGGVFIQANTAAHSALAVLDENFTHLIECSDGDSPLIVKDITGTLKETVGSTGLGFYGHAQAGKQTVTGSKGANAALTSLIAALVAVGFITDTTT